MQAFVQEVEEAGRMTSERRELFRELERPSNAQSSIVNNQQVSVLALSFASVCVRARKRELFVSGFFPLGEGTFGIVHRVSLVFVGFHQ